MGGRTRQNGAVRYERFRHVETKRPARVPVHGVQLRVAATSGCLVNISATGALVRAAEPLTPNLEYPFFLETPAARVRFTARVIRSTGAQSDTADSPVPQEYLVAVTFAEMPPNAKHAVAALCGDAYARRE